MVMKTANKIMMPNGEEIGIDGLYGKITNCLLEVPQRIKLELNNGVLTLKAGSQVIVPNGFEEDGVTPRFDYVTLQNDLVSDDQSYTYTGNVFVMINANASAMFTERSIIMSSGSTPSNYDSHGSWYDTTTNKVKRTTNSGSTWNGDFALPIAICTRTDTVNTSISQTFNGLGYIGSTVWVDKGVKGLIPNGRNEDGTLKNIEFTTDKVMTNNLTFTGTQDIRLSGSSIGLGRLIYNSVKNWNTPENSNELRWFIPIAEVNANSGVISNFYPKQPFRAPDIQDVVRKTGDTMYGHLNFINNNITDSTVTPSTSQYTGITFYDAKGQRYGKLEGQWSKNGYTAFGFNASRTINGSIKYSNVSTWIDSDGSTNFDFPKCTTKATTTSSAKSARVAVVVGNYVNGTTWYRVWSDGWIEQGGQSAGSSFPRSITLGRAFSNTNYTLVAVDCAVSTSNVSNSNKVGIQIRSGSKFDLYSDQGLTTVRWYACGY